MIYLILILGLALRLISINQSLWLDEATTALVSKMNLVDFFAKFIPNDFHPPLYYLILNLWTNFAGYSEISLRLPSVIFGVLTVYVVYLIARETKIKYVYLPSLFLATSGLHIYYSQEARMYSLAAFLITTIVYLYLKKKWVLFSIFIALLFFVDYLSILIVPALLFHTLLSRKNDIKRFIRSLIPLFVSFLFWLPIFLKQLNQGLSVKSSISGWWSILGSVTVKNILLIPTKFIIGRVSIENKTLYTVAIFLLLALVLYTISKAKDKLMWLWLMIPILLGVLISFFIPTLTYFRYLFVLPAFYLLISENTNKMLIVLFLIINIITSGAYLSNHNFQRENWREVARIIGSEKIVFPADSQKEALIYYGKEGQIIKKEQIEPNDTTIWLSRYVWDVFDRNDLTRKYIEDLGYNKVMETNLNGVVLFKYANSN